MRNTQSAPYFLQFRPHPYHRNVFGSCLPSKIAVSREKPQGTFNWRLVAAAIAVDLEWQDGAGNYGVGRNMLTEQSELELASIGLYCVSLGARAPI